MGGWGGAGWGGGPLDFSVSPRPLGLGFWGFGAMGLGPRLDKKREREEKGAFEWLQV